MLLTCKSCNEAKEETSFYFRKDSGKFRSECKECWCVKTDNYRRDNLDKAREYTRKYGRRVYNENPEKYREKSRIFRQENPESVKTTQKNSYLKKQSNLTDSDRQRRRENSRKWYSKNTTKVQESARKHRLSYPERHCARQNKRRALKTNAAPQWLTELHIMQIQWYYAAAKMMTETSGIPHEVDHIHPLKGDGFNGLHVPWNLQILTASENRRKSNKLGEV